MANQYLTIGMVTQECLRILENELSFTKGVNREYQPDFAEKGWKIGDTLNIRKPPRWRGRFGQTMSTEDMLDKSVPLVISTQFGVDMQFTSKDLKLSIDDFADRYLKTAISQIANQIDSDGLLCYQQVNSAVVTPDSTGALFKPFLNAGALLNLNGTPVDDDRSAVIDPATQANLVDYLKSMFQDSSLISQQYRKGKMGIAAGFTWAQDQNVRVHTVGSAAADTITVNGAGQTGTSITVSGLVGTLNVGDVFTIDGVHLVNPQQRQNTGVLAQFVVTATQTGGTVINFYPALDATTQWQTVDALPANGAAIHVQGTSGLNYKECLVHHKDAFTLACVDLDVTDDGVKMARVSDSRLGISIRTASGYDITNDIHKFRIDVLYGWKAIYPELACRVRSTSQLSF